MQGFTLILKCFVSLQESKMVNLLRQSKIIESLFGIINKVKIMIYSIDCGVEGGRRYFDGCPHF